MVRHKVVVGSDGKTATDRFERTIHVEGDLTGEQRAELLKIADRCQPDAAAILDRGQSIGGSIG